VFGFLVERAALTSDIFLACVRGDAAGVAAALAAGPTLVRVRTAVSHPLGWGLTPLHFAARYGHTAIAALLLERGADVNATARSSKDMTPLHLVVWLSAGEAIRVQTELPRLLIGHGADLDAWDSDRHLTPLGWAEAVLQDDEKDRRAVAATLRAFRATR
jgi:hypothetical protein